MNRLKAAYRESMGGVGFAADAIISSTITWRNPKMHRVIHAASIHRCNAGVIVRSYLINKMCGVAAYFCLTEGAIARRISAAISPCERNALLDKKPSNPLGVGCFDRLRRWLGSQSPLWGFSCLAVLDSAKTTPRTTHPIYEIASK
jgi:hypothetical protein